jgi:hypothetical protein
MARALHVLVVVVAALSADVARAGAWTKPPGGGYVKLGSASFVSSFAYDDAGERAATDPYLLQAQTLYFYGEVGVAPNLTLTGYVPYVLATNHQTDAKIRFTTIGLGDVSAGATLGLVQGGPLVLAAKLDVKVPLYEGAPSVRGLSTRTVPGFPRSATLFPALGDGQIDLTPAIAFGGALPFLDGFFTTEAANRLRTGPVTDAFVVAGTGGVHALSRRLLILVDAAWILSLPAGDDDEIVGKGYFAGGPGFMYYLVGGTALEAGFQFVARGVNAAGGYSALVGVSHAF